ncbi:MAG: L-histidine N(alpha)-methyltransferase [Hyphomicrobiales bacterium]|nr:L-histidine N(alpha)-methyltransferase [Hyphomicrobiales bacterium]
MAESTVLETADTFRGEFAEAVLDGLARDVKEIPCRFLYDARGSVLFEEITQLPEYYPTRTEIGLLESHAPDIAKRAGSGCALVEFGSGSSRKTGKLIDQLDDLAAYVPIDIAHEALSEAADRLTARNPDLTILPVHADFNQDVQLPGAVQEAPKLGFFPGSTIGNLTQDEAADFLNVAGDLLGPESAFVVGVDLKKDTDILIPAYDDAQGVTADFNLNLLHRINRELDGDFDVSQFAHEVIYNPDAGRIESYIVSLADQEAHVLGEPVAFSEGERIHTESSHKYAVDEFQTLARANGWQPSEVWTDPQDLFSLHYLDKE